MDFPYELPSNETSAVMDYSILESIAQKFKTMQAAGSFPGGQLVVRRHNQVVLNVVTGVARGYRDTEAQPPQMVQPNTPFPVYSLGKSLAAIAIAMLEEQGILDIHMPIAKLFPEFGSHGKEHITTLDVLTHTAGIFVPALYQNYKQFINSDVLWTQIINATPTYKRGVLAYMPWEYGIILQEIVWKLVGTSLADFVATEITLPLHLPSLHYGLTEQTTKTCAHSYWLGGELMIIADVNIAKNCETIKNAPEVFRSQNPALSLVTDASNMAAFYECLLHGGITKSGQQLLSEKTIALYTSKAVMGWDKSFGLHMAMGRGFMVGRKWMPSIYGWWGTQRCFGHVGGVGSLAFGCHKTKLAGAIITNGHRSIFDCARRFIPMVHRLRQACL